MEQGSSTVTAFRAVRVARRCALAVVIVFALPAVMFAAAPAATAVPRHRSTTTTTTTTTAPTITLTAPYASATGECYLHLSPPVLSECEESHDPVSGRLALRVKASTPGAVATRAAGTNAMTATFVLSKATNLLDISISMWIERLSITTDGTADKARELDLQASASHSSCSDCGGGENHPLSTFEWNAANEGFAVVDRGDTMNFTMKSWSGPIPPGTITITLSTYESAWVFGQEYYDEPVPGAPYCDSIIRIQCQRPATSATPGSATVDSSIVMSKVAITPR